MRTFLPAAIVVALSALAALGFAGPALAHVKVSGTDTTQGGYGVMTFRVPTESDTASTTELRVTLPEDSPIMSVSTQPKPGWTATVTKTNLTTPQKDDDGNQVNQYVSQVDWKADNPQAAIPPHQFDTFNLSVGPLPKAATLSLPAEQFYSDGSTVNWNQKAADGQAAPEHPTPVLTLASASSGQTATSASSAPHDSGATWPGIAGLVVAIIAVLLAVANFALLRRKS